MSPVHVLGQMGDEPKKKRGTKSGHAYERQYAAILREQGWFVMRSPASKGVCDLIAIRPQLRPHTTTTGYRNGCEVLFVEVKSTTRGPFAGFPPKDRDELISAAAVSGATPVLAWKRPRGEWQTFPVSEWPATQEKAA
jgi:Holliday junction resolvase